jgi:hypothetical protein
VSFRVFRYVAAAAAVFMGTFASARSDLAFMRSITVHLMSEGEGIGAVEYIVSPKGLEALRSSRIKHDVLIEDLQPIVDEQRRRRAERRAGGGIAGVSWFDDYKTYDEYNAKLAELEALRPDLASVFLVGLSIEGREIRGIRITGPGADKPAVLINGCQHAREWIAPKATIYAADRLIGEYDVDPVVKDLVDDVEFLLVPIVNPDGYVYSWGSDRWWRTNRRDNGDGTFGVDLNRNWAYEWGHDNGSSPVPGHELYRGPAPFSEPETQAMRDLFQANPQIVGNIDFHSYGQLILYPWSYGYDIAPDALLLHLLGETMAASIQGVHGRHYNNQQGVIPQLRGGLPRRARHGGVRDADRAVRFPVRAAPGRRGRGPDRGASGDHVRLGPARAGHRQAVRPGRSVRTIQRYVIDRPRRRHVRGPSAGSAVWGGRAVLLRGVDD